MESLTGKQPIGNQQHAGIDANGVTRKRCLLVENVREPSREAFRRAGEHPHREAAPPVDAGMVRGVRALEVTVVEGAGISDDVGVEGTGHHDGNPSPNGAISPASDSAHRSRAPFAAE